MIQIFADDALVYDSRLEEYDLESLSITTGLNIGGTATITMPHGHPAYDFFVGYKTIITIYRDSKLRFRGRALYPTEDFYRSRTITCEGEMCMLRDGISRPYLYQDSPAAIFAAVIQSYNSQVETWKQFRVGKVTVTDANDYLRLESESAETVLDTINKLVERCGGYIVFSEAEDGARLINWYANAGVSNNQVIEFGENLLNFAVTGANTTLATGLVPYGAADEDTQKRLTIESVNGGKDFILAEDAKSIRGTIMATATWNDVTDPANLLRKAQAYLEELKVFVTSLELTALDLSYLDKDLDSFTVGDMIRVKSPPHGLDEDFQLTQLVEDLLHPEMSIVTLGKDLKSLTGAYVAGVTGVKNQAEADKILLKSEFIIGIEQVAADLERSLSSLIDQSETAILLQVSQTYARQDALTELEKDMTAKIAAMAGIITMEVSGGLGGTASIVLTVNGETQTQTLDLANIRQAFADDHSQVVISGGTVTFNSGTFVVNSENLQIDATGTISATNAILSGTMTTEGEIFTSVLASGWLRFYYGETLCGGIAAGHYGSSDNRGIALRLEKEAKYLGFSKDFDEDGTYELWYCINFGANPEGYTNQHIFFGSVRFTESVYFDNEVGVALSNVAKDVTAKAVYMSTFDNVIFGDLGFETHVRGSKLSLGLNEYETHLYGLGGITFHARADFGTYAADFGNMAGIRIATSGGNMYYVLRVDESDNCHVGNDYTKLRLRGSAVVLHSSGAAVSSDRRKKNSIEGLPEAYMTALDKMTPVRFKFNDGTSGRYHVGFIAQDVEQALTDAGLADTDFGGFVDLNGDGAELGLIYTEFIGLLHEKLRRLENRIKELEGAQV